MNILIVGEFSAFAKHLKDGFQKLGHNAYVVTTGDTFKKIPSDKDDILYPETKSLTLFGHHIPKSYYIANPITNICISRQIRRRGLKYDLVVIINDTFVSNQFYKTGVKLDYIKQLKAEGSKIILSCCGNDPAYCEFYKELRYSEEYEKAGCYTPPSSLRIDRFDYLLQLSDWVVPTSYEYWYAICKYAKTHNIQCRISNVIMLPITVEGDVVIDRNDNDKIVIFHGINDEQKKGTAYFVDALDRIQKDYLGKVETVVAKRLPYNEYLAIMNKMDILLDQTNSYGFGINACLGLMKGKIVFSGYEPEMSSHVGVSSPIVNVIPDSSMIYDQLKYFIENPAKILEARRQSRRFALDYLSSDIIAQQYINLIQ